MVGTETSKDAPEVFHGLEIQQRVLKTPTRTIAIGNISTITVGVVKHERMAVLFLLGLGAFALAIGASQNPYAGNQNAAVLALVGALLLAAWWFAVPDSEPYLTIGTNSGSLTRFVGKVEDLEKVRDILADKINTDNKQATYSIDFSSGTIETLHVANVEKVAAQNVVAGDGNVVSSNSPGAKVGTRDVEMRAENSPGAQVGIGSQVGTRGSASSTSSATTVTLEPLDFSSILTDVHDLLGFCRSQNDPALVAIADQLDELEKLMRSGAPSLPERSRLRDVANDLATASTIVSVAPQWVQVFQSVARMAAGG